MVDFLLLTSLIIISVEFIAYSSILIEQIIFFENFYTVTFLLFFVFNFFVINKEEKFNFNIDLIVKYYLFFLRVPNFFLNFIVNTFKQIYVFLIYFKYKFVIDTNFMILKNIYKTFSLIWRPLFKKFSYFGYFRSNRSK